MRLGLALYRVEEHLCFSLEVSDAGPEGSRSRPAPKSLERTEGEALDFRACPRDLHRPGQDGAGDGEAEQTRRARRGREQDVAEISRRMYDEIRSSRDPRDHVEDG